MLNTGWSNLNPCSWGWGTVLRTTLEVTWGSCSVTTGNPKGVRLNDKKAASLQGCPFSNTRGTTCLEEEVGYRLVSLVKNHSNAKRLLTPV